MNNQRGQSLIQVLVAFAIMGILMMAISSMFTTMNRENRALSEKLAALDLERAVTQTLTNPALCSALFDPSNLVVAGSLPIADATGISSAKPKTIQLKNVKGSASGQNLASLGALVSPSSNTLNIAATNGISLVFTTPTTASLQLNFDQSKLIRPIMSLNFHLALQSDWPTNSPVDTITGCQGAGGGGALQASPSFVWDTGGAVGCPGWGTVTKTSTPITYTAKGTKLVIHASTGVITVGVDSAGVYYDINITGPGVNQTTNVYYLGSQNKAQTASSGSKTLIVSVTQGATYTITAQVRCEGNVTLSDGSLAILDF